RADTEPFENGQSLAVRFAGVQPIQSPGVEHVFHRTQLFEERRLDTDAVDQLLDLELVSDDIETEQLYGARVREEQRRDDANERRLARPVGAQDAENLTPRNVERHVVHCHNPSPSGGLLPRQERSATRDEVLGDAMQTERGGE